MEKKAIEVKGDNIRKREDKKISVQAEPVEFAQTPQEVKAKNLSFQSFKLCRGLLKAINELNWTSPTPIQAETIPIALKAKDITACATTGSGKTAAFMIPIIERLSYKSSTAHNFTRALIIAPTRELAVQIYQTTRNLTAYLPSISHCLLAGGLDLSSQTASLRNNPDIVIATPGRLIDHVFNTPSWALDSVEVMVLDEADRILEENFQEQLDEISKQCARERQTMMFSATMTEKVKDLERVCLKNPTRVFINDNTATAENLHQQFVRVREESEVVREALCASLVERNFPMHTLVFTRTKEHAHRLNIILGLIDIRAGELHGNMKQKDRLENLNQFKDGDIDVLVCTDLASRGLDIPCVQNVINFSMPNSYKIYVHRVGRTARAGKSGTAISLVGERDRTLFEKIIKMNKKNAHATKLENRSVPAEVIAEYQTSIQDLESDIKEILAQEEAEKSLNIAESQLEKAEKLVKNDPKKPVQAKRKWLDTDEKSSMKKQKITKNEKQLGSFGKELADTSRKSVKKLKHDAGIKRKLHSGVVKKNRQNGQKGQNRPVKNKQKFKSKKR